MFSRLLVAQSSGQDFATQAFLALPSGISKSAVGCWLSGRDAPQVSIARLCSEPSSVCMSWQQSWLCWAPGSALPFPSCDFFSPLKSSYLPLARRFLQREALWKRSRSDHLFFSCSSGSFIVLEKWLLLLFCCFWCCFLVTFLLNGLVTFKLISKRCILDFLNLFLMINSVSYCLGATSGSAFFSFDNFKKSFIWSKRNLLPGLSELLPGLLEAIWSPQLFKWK